MIQCSLVSNVRVADAEVKCLAGIPWPVLVATCIAEDKPIKSGIHLIKQNSCRCLFFFFG